MKFIHNYTPEEKVSLYMDIEKVEHNISSILKELKKKHPIIIKKIDIKRGVKIEWI